VPRVQGADLPAASHLAEPVEREGEVSVFVFGKGDGGSVDSNVARWQGQFQADGKSPKEPPAPKKTKIGTIDVTIVTTEGTYASGMPGGASTPKNAWTVDFDALVKSLRRS
jgi:hypothetical protein